MVAVTGRMGLVVADLLAAQLAFDGDGGLVES
jgi:hypothetical protein